MDQNNTDQNFIEQLKNMKPDFINLESVMIAFINKNEQKSPELKRNQNIILRKYFDLWQEFTKKSQYLRENLTKHDKIEAFLQNIIKKKNELNSKNSQKLSQVDSISNSSSSTKNSKSSNSEKHTKITCGQSFQHRYQSQKNIIALQKTKLEQQERIIEELKFKKIVENASLSNEVAAEVCKTLHKCDRQIKPKLKCLMSDNEALEETDKYFELTCMKVPKFLQKMEQRAREREEKRATVQERRRQIELEKEKHKEQMELARQQMDQEEKNKRINEFKEKRRQEQLICIRKKEFRDKMRALSVMADLHYERKIMDKYGLNVWKLYIIKLNDDFVKSISYHLHKLLKNHFEGWKNYTHYIKNQRNFISDNLYQTKILKLTFDQWKMEHKVMVNKRQVAEDWFDLRVTERLFFQWRSNVTVWKIIRRRQWETAVQNYNSRIKWRTIGYWQMLPKINSIERQHEARKERWRAKVQQVIPDFIPRQLDF